MMKKWETQFRSFNWAIKPGIFCLVWINVLLTQLLCFVKRPEGKCGDIKNFAIYLAWHSLFTRKAMSYCLLSIQLDHFCKGAFFRGKGDPPVLEEPVRHRPRQGWGLVRPSVTAQHYFFRICHQRTRAS